MTKQEAKEIGVTCVMLVVSFYLGVCVRFLIPSLVPHPENVLTVEFRRDGVCTARAPHGLLKLSHLQPLCDTWARILWLEAHEAGEAEEQGAKL